MTGADRRFPIGGANPIGGGVYVQGGCFLAKMYVKTKKLGPVVGVGWGGVGATPGSANGRSAFKFEN